MNNELPTYDELQATRSGELHIDDLIEARRDDHLPTPEQLAEAVNKPLLAFEEIREVQR